MKQLYLVRHAKSSWDDASLTDLQRPLNNRGMRNAPEMAERLALANTSVDLIITSPASRALMTAQYLAQGIGYETDRIVPMERLYFSGSATILEQIQNTDTAIQSLMLVGHNPDMTSLFNRLCGFQTDNMPTCSIATIQFQQQWSDICQSEAKLTYYDYPKKR